MQLPEIASLGVLAPRYDALLCDVWGVVHNGRRPFMDACAALARFRAERGPVALITNSPRPSSEIPGQFRQIGVPDGICDAIITSGDVTRTELEKRAPGLVHKIGPGRDEPIYAGLALEDAPLAEADFISCTGLGDEYRETAQDYRERLRPAAERGVVMVCANPDIVVHVGEHLIPCAGAVGEVYAALGGPVVLAGKPYRPIYDLALARLAQIMGGAPDKARILAVGDGAMTDIGGANGAGIDACFIAAGIHRDILGPDGRPDAAAVAAELARAGAHARWAARDLEW
jgi:HAD superfamily hydrolase (TIGR01459 family)